MTSSMLTGERRYPSTRRGGMTVLGKVAVPKPINLPSQKLENHGLDPNVEIVPKGTLSWGSKSSSASNAWGSSTLSPTADGGGSPSHFSGRPSSGGSGTRPSTGGSDKAHEPISNAWISNSRPSSASGALTSNQTAVTSLRPRSAETRPGSSQLSRFAERLSDNPVAWGSAGTAEKLGVTSSKKDGFSLASGDFPTLGSDKDNAGKNMESQDHGSHGRPGSSSGGVAPVNDRTGDSAAGDGSANPNVKSGATNSWKRENILYCEDGVRANMEKWQADPPGPQPYPNAGIPPQHYEPWHGPPINNHPGGVWYRGPPGPPPYGSPLPPGGFPMEPFHFYRPQIPANALPNPQPVPPPGAGPRAHHPKNGDMFRPPVPDAYMRPGMPIRPGFYPGPVAYEGYYGPPMGYHNSNEREMPFMGMGAGPPAYNRYPGQNAHDVGNSHTRSGGYGPNGNAMTTEQLESGRSHDARGPYRVLLKQHDGWDEKNDEHKWEDTITTNAAYVEKGDQPRASSWGDDCRGDYAKDEEMSSKRKALGEEASFQASDHEGGFSSLSGKVKPSESMRNAKAFDDISVKKVQHAASTFPEVPAAPKDTSLIQKIEGLNAKARASDGRHDVSREEQKNKPQVLNLEAKHIANEAVTGSVYFERNNVTGTNKAAAREVSVSYGDNSVESAAVSRRSSHGMHARPDHRGKGRFNNPQEVDGWRKKSPVSNSSSVVPAAHSESYSNVHMQDPTAKEATEKSGNYPQEKDEGECVPPMSDPSDSQAQRAKMKELAKQRVIQRQKEEEERTRDQKAKALAKLEELNRRTQVVEGVTHKSEVFPVNAILDKQDESQSLAESTVVVSKSGVISSALASNSKAVMQFGEIGLCIIEKSPVFSSELLLERPKSAHKEPVETHKHNESIPTKQDVDNADAVHHNNTSQAYDGGVSKQKRMGYKQKQNIPLEMNSTEKFVTTSAIQGLQGHGDSTVNAATSVGGVANEIAPSSESSLRVNPNVMPEPPTHQKRRNNRGGKKHKVEETSSAAILPSAVLKETTAMNTLGGSGKTKASESELDSSSIQLQTDSKDTNLSSEQRLSSPTEENHGRANTQLKSQHSRRMPRNAQANKPVEKVHTGDAVVWAPVRTHNKAEVGEASQKSLVEASSSVKSDHQVHNNSRNKRAEMERYIPKPVAKEMAKQGSSQQESLAHSVDGTMSDEISGFQCAEGSQPAGLASGKIRIAMESRNGESRQNKQGKGHGWRQRASVESNIVQGLQDGQSLNASRHFQKSFEHHQPQKSDLSSVKEQPEEEWGISDGWNIPEYPDSSVPVVKDQGVTGRGKRHQFKGHKGTGNNHDHKKMNSGDTDKSFVQSSVPIPEMNQTDLPSALKENRAVGDQSTSHWKPKPHAFSASNQRGSRTNSGQNTGAEVGRGNKKDSTSQGGLPVPSQLDKETSEGKVQPHHGQTKKVEEAPSMGQQESKRERKTLSVKGNTHFSNQGPGSLVDTAPGMDTQHEQHGSSGFRRNGNQNNRFGRGHESRGDWSTSGQDNKQHNRERQRHNPSHYEYQPVGPQNNNRANNYEGPKDGPPNNAGGRYRERGQGHSRRGGGNFHGRPSGSVRADGGYD